MARLEHEQWPYGISASRQMQPDGPLFAPTRSASSSPQGQNLLAQQTLGSPTKALNGSSREASPVSANHYRRDAKGNDGKAGIGIQLTQNADGSFVIENVPPGVRQCVLVDGVHRVRRLVLLARVLVLAHLAPTRAGREGACE